VENNQKKDKELERYYYALDFIGTSDSASDKEVEESARKVMQEVEKLLEIIEPDQRP